MKKEAKKPRAKRRGLRICLLILLLLILFGSVELLYSNYALRVSAYTLSSEKLRSPVRVVFLADLHGRVFGEHNEKLLTLIAEQQPDLIAVVGDLFNNNADEAEIDAMCAFLQKALEIAPVYFSMGNQEAAYLRSHSTDLTARILETGVTVLDNNYLDLELQGSPVRIGGYMGYYRQPGMMTWDPEQKQLELAFAEDFENTGRFKLLLNHIPTAWLDWGYINKYAVDLVLSGHYHGGVVRVPLLDKGLYAPYIGWFPPFTKGLFQGKKAACILTAGLAGSFGLPRFFNPPEICVVDLLPAQ